MKNILFLLLCCGMFLSATAQETKKFFLEPGSQEGYLAVFPESAPKAFLVLVGSYGETAEEVIVNSAIPEEAARNGILTIVPLFSTGTTSLGFDKATQDSFQRILQLAIENHDLQEMPFFTGGFSIGGTAVIKHAELIQEQQQKTPAAVFAIDPPLDMERLYNSAKRDIRLSVDKEPARESVFLVDRLEQEFGGSPEDVPRKFREASPYSFSDTTQKAVKELVQVPLRIYTEPDLEFYSSKGMDFFSMNAFDASALVNELQRLGNKEAELVVSHNKGFREPGHVKNPHSWSIVDAEDLITWLLKHH